MGVNVYWTEQEMNYLRRNHAAMTVKELTAGLIPISPKPRNADDVRAKCRTSGFKAKPEGRHVWTKEEVEYLMKHFGAKDIEDIAAMLGVSEKAATDKFYKSGGASWYMKRVTPWMDGMRKKIDDTGESIYDMSNRLYDAGRVVSVEENKEDKLALFCRTRR